MNLLITGAVQKNEEFFEEIRRAGHSIVYVPDERIPLTEQNVDPTQFEGVICGGLFVHTSIEQFTKLRFVQLTSAGYDRAPLDYIKEKHIEIHNAKAVYSIPMAEFAIGGVLQFYKRSRAFYESQQSRKWEKQRSLLELARKTAVIIGCGDVGRECAKRLQAFDCRVIGVNRTVRNEPYFDSVVLLSELREVLLYADIVISAVALTGETTHLLGKEEFRQMKGTALLVNISRGAVVDTGSLIEWLEREPHAGAVLDVFEEEPLSADSPLWSLKNVVLTPHNSFVGENNTLRLMNVIRKTLKLSPICG